MKRNIFLFFAFLSFGLLVKAQGFSSVDAVVNWGNGKAYFFKGNQYIRYDIATDRADQGYPQPFNASTWPGVGNYWSSVDAVVNWGNGKAYFFKGNQYIRYDIAGNRADEGYPKYISETTWPGVGNIWSSIDAVVNWGNGKAYMFQGNQYIRYDIAADRADAGYPQPINASTWPGIGNVWNGIDAAVNWTGGKIFFFKGNQYTRYNVAADKVDEGYPRSINNTTWPGLGPVTSSK